MKKFICMLLAAVLICALCPGVTCAEAGGKEPGVTVYFPNWNIYSINWVIFIPNKFT